MASADAEAFTLKERRAGDEKESAGGAVYYDNPLSPGGAAVSIGQSRMCGSSDSKRGQSMRGQCTSDDFTQTCVFGRSDGCVCDRRDIGSTCELLCLHNPRNP